ncbi:prokaryotic type I DNA topoisomerase [Martensiomyces pterosporus]|nr:prokaryotic type I DNA topoisomerase [Martensiomyces pterosporus]
MRILCVAEKPSQAKSIVQILSQGQFNTRNGRSKYNKNFDFQYRVSGSFVPATMTSVLGHVMEIDFPLSMRKWHSCNPVTLFTAPIVKGIIENVKDVAANVEQEARTATHLYIWTDCDREGEGIGSEVMALCRGVNPRIVVKRAHFSSVLPQEIHNAMQSPRNLDMRLVAAVEARTELDLRIGSALTRFQTLRLQSRFAAVQDKVISYGPCQFPTLGFVVDQFLRVDNFVPESFWYIFLEHVKDDGKAVFTWKRQKLFDQEACFALYAKCMAQPAVSVVSVRSRPKEKWRPLPLTTVELQKCCARFLRLSPDSIMSIAEGLYNQGFISYPRTETDQFDKNMDLKSTVAKLTQFQPLSGYAQRLVNGEFRWPRQGKNNDKAHPPIHPVAPANNLTGDAKRVYEFVTRRFLACCSDNAKGQATEVDVEVAGERFYTNGLMIIARNYLDVYPYDKWSESTVPIYRQGDAFQPSTLEMRTSKTTAPKLLKDEDLVGIMDKNGIGTDATHADHIKKIIEREYIFKSPDGYLSPSTLGIGLVEGYDAIGLELSLSKPHLRREMEIELKQICDGIKTKDDVVRQSVNLYKAVYTKSAAEVEKLEDALSRCLQEAPIADRSAAWAPMSGGSGDEAVFKCPVCDGTLNLRSKASGGWMIGCGMYPQCKKAVWVPDIVSSIAVSGEDCPRCSSNPKGPAKLLDICFKPGSVPPGTPARYRGCVRGCDELINEMFDVRPPQQQAQPQRNSSALPSTGAYSASSSAPAGVNGNPDWQPANTSAQFTMLAPPQYPPPMQSHQQYHHQQYHQQQQQQQHQHQQQHQQSNNGLSNNPLCDCGILSVHRVTAKEGPNKGRPFYKCSKSPEAQCSFFQWADQPAPSLPRTNNGNYSGGSGGSMFNDAAPTTKPKCKCGLFASLKQATKDGPNKGREYFACTKTFQGCGFVCWRDDVDAYMNGTLTRQPPSSGGPGGSSSPCFRCGQVGHWSRDCPNPGDGSGMVAGPSSGAPAAGGPARRGRSRGRGRGTGAKTRARGRGRGRKSRSSENSDPDPDFAFWS